MAEDISIKVKLDGADKVDRAMSKLGTGAGKVGEAFSGVGANISSMSEALGSGLGEMGGGADMLAQGLAGLKTAAAGGSVSLMGLLGPLSLLAGAVSGVVLGLKNLYENFTGASENAEKLKARVDELRAGFDEFLSMGVRLTGEEIQKLTTLQIEYKLAADELAETQAKLVEAEIKRRDAREGEEAAIKRLFEAESQLNSALRDSNDELVAIGGNFGLSMERGTAQTRQLEGEISTLRATIADSRAELERLGKDPALEVLANKAIAANKRLEALKEQIASRSEENRKKETEKEKKGVDDLAAKRKAAYQKMLADEEALRQKAANLRVSLIQDAEERALKTVKMAHDRMVADLDKSTARFEAKYEMMGLIIESNLNQQAKIREAFAQKLSAELEAEMRKEEDARKARAAAYLAAMNEQVQLELAIQANAEAGLQKFNDRLSALQSGVSGSLAIMTSSSMDMAERMKESLGDLDVLLDGVGTGFASAAVDAMMAKGSFAEMLKELADSVAKEAFVSGLLETAKGVGRLAVGDAAGGAMHFKAAGIYAAVGGAALAVGAAAGGGGGGGGTQAAPVQPEAPTREDFADERSAAPVVLNVNFAGDVYDSEYAASQALAARVTRAMNASGRGRPQLRTRRA